jgi:putative spermidine/putrescine transport system permease protein
MGGLAPTSRATGDAGTPVPTGAAFLRASLRRAERRQTLRALGLVAPLVLFLLLNFAAPIGLMLPRSIQDPELGAALPRTAALLRQADAARLPDERIAAILVDELVSARERGTLSAVANRLNYDINGFRTLLLRTARQLPLTGGGPLLPQLARIDARWSDREYWAAMRHAAGPLTSFYLLAALDRRLTSAGGIATTPPEQAIFIGVFRRTFWISLVVTVLCLTLGYPVAYLLATLPERFSHPLLILVLLPFWTSVLVRTTAWVVLLQRHGIVNDLLQWLRLIGEPVQLIYNRTGVYVAMTYVLLPFMILPLYGVMKGISPFHMRAALSLGAGPIAAFRRVYLPQTRPGISAGCVLVFILAIGFYITPALVGGADDQMISYFIAFYTNQTLNWGMAGALSLLLLIATLLLYGVYHRLTGGTGLRWR